MNHPDADAWKEQTAFERAQWERKASRVLLVALEEPDMPLPLLAERFGLTEASVRHLLHGAGVYREPDYFSASFNGARRMAG